MRGLIPPPAEPCDKSLATVFIATVSAVFLKKVEVFDYLDEHSVYLCFGQITMKNLLGMLGVLAQSMLLFRELAQNLPKGFNE